MAQVRDGKLPFLGKLGYGLGDLYGGGATTLISMFYLYFLVDVGGISPALAGTAFLVSKLYDAVTDPVMGLISDNTRTRFGRRRPYLLAGIPLVFLSFAAMWVKLSAGTEAVRFAYYLAAYLFFSTVYTMVWVPYNAIAAELTEDYDERSRLSVWRMLFSNLSGILAAMLPKDLFENYLFRGDAAAAFRAVGIAFGLFYALAPAATFLFCRERREFASAPKRKMGNPRSFIAENFIQPFKVRPFRQVAAMYLMGFMAMDAMLALAVYFLTYIMEVSSMMALLVPVYGGLVAALPGAAFVAPRIGKRATFLGSCLLWLIALAMVPFLRAGMPLFFLYAFGLLFGVGLAGVQTMVFALFSDVPDADELVSGRRREGLFSGIFALLRKSGGALVMFLLGLVLQASGYAPPVEGVVQGQTPRFLGVLRGAFMCLPLVLVLGAAWAALRYRLDRGKLEEIRSIAAARRAGRSDAETERRAAALAELIGG